MHTSAVYQKSEGGPLSSMAATVRAGAEEQYCSSAGVAENSVQAGTSMAGALMQGVILKCRIWLASFALWSLPVKGWAWEMFSPSMIWLCTKAELDMKWKVMYMTVRYFKYDNAFPIIQSAKIECFLILKNWSEPILRYFVNLHKEQDNYERKIF